LFGVGRSPLDARSPARTDMAARQVCWNNNKTSIMRIAIARRKAHGKAKRKKRRRRRLGANWRVANINSISAGKAYQRNGVAYQDNARRFGKHMARAATKQSNSHVIIIGIDGVAAGGAAAGNGIYGVFSATLCCLSSRLISLSYVLKRARCGVVNGAG